MTGQYQFSDKTFNAKQNTLSQNGYPQPLEQKVSQLLELFCRSDGRVIRKSELLEQLWPDRVVNEDSLSVAVSKLRKALGDDRHQPIYIKTISGVGYQWLPQTQCFDSESAEDANAQSEPVSQVNESPSSVKRTSAVLLFLVALVAPAWFWWPAESTPVDSQKAETVTLSESFRQQLEVAGQALESNDGAQLKQAIVTYRNVLERHPDYLPAYMGIARAKFELSHTQTSFASLQLYKDEIRALAEHVLEKDPENDEAWLMLATIRFLADWDFESADSAYLNALKYGPDEPTNYLTYSEFLITQGKFEQAREQLDRLRAINPSYYRFVNMTFVHFMQREYDLAMAEVQRLINSEVDSRGHHVMAHRVALMQGKEATAFRKLKVLMAEAGFDELRIKTVERVYHEGGLTAVFRHFLEQELPENVGHYRPPLALARYAILAGDKAAALDWLRTAVAQKQSTVLLVPVDPLYQSLFGFPGFAELLEQIPSA
ncbi:hypothetical protein HMF8227_01084 [Saliniradius amylolyticus]|uniref:OmpR/PhoB-type domain-containing protein n=1 Tax=Saliniradius amylolyticus TaxID=2183582 RepID=A0A2S2E2T7_9ALTE|nr:tetratricopeptide repeat protein [Saliniradius amylolyticus]AWL11570.1 hypothetical protein HMF8227_01084 [Saliniradius amylolyticus]